MLETLRQLPERSVQGGGDADFLAPLSDGAVHEIDFCLALSQNVLQHAGAVLAGGVGAFLNELSWIPMRSEEHTSELQSRQYLVCRLLLEKKKKEKKFPQAQSNRCNSSGNFTT